MSKINILNLATSDEGGAGIASLYFNELFNKMGHKSLLFVKQSKSTSKKVIAIKRLPANPLSQFFLKVMNRLKRLMNKNGTSSFENRYFFFNVDESEEYISASQILEALPFKPDVILLHWISNFINSITIHELAKKTHAKILWLMIDNAPLTGGCHYPWDCKGYQSDCADCPAILDNSKNDISKRNLALKKHYLPENMELISCSESDFMRAKGSALFKDKTVHKILFPIDENKFAPANKNLAKQFFCIAAGKKVIFYGASTLSNVRKGEQCFLKALLILQEMIKKEGRALNEWVVLVAGRGDKKLFNHFEIPVLHTGFLNEGGVIKAYQAADVFVSPSIEDSGPLMVNQSVMCGTPVVAFETGVALDLVITKKTGYLAKMKDSEDLAMGIKTILELNKVEYDNMSKYCRELGMRKCHSKVQANAFMQILQCS